MTRRQRSVRERPHRGQSPAPGEEFPHGAQASLNAPPVRTPMQWTAGQGAGFSLAGPNDLVAPIVTGGFAPEHVNVSQQRHDPDSFLRYIQSLIRHYRSAPEIGWGRLTLLDQPHPCVLLHSVSSELGMLVAAHNFAPDGRSFRVEIDGAAEGWRVVELLADAHLSQSLEGGGFDVQLDGYGHRWWRVIRPGERRLE